MNNYFDTIRYLREEALKQKEINLDDAKLFIFHFDEMIGNVLSGTEADKELLKRFNGKPDGEQENEFKKLKKILQKRVKQSLDSLGNDTDVILKYKKELAFLKYFYVKDTGSRGRKREFAALVISKDRNIGKQLRDKNSAINKQLSSLKTYLTKELQLCFPQ